MRTLEAGRLTLVPQTAAHADAMFVVLSDPAIYRYENEAPLSIDWLRHRFSLLESRQSADGREQWLNWVIQLPNAELIGFVQATVRADGTAAIAYELCSSHWGRGLGSLATATMIEELLEHYQVRTVSAVLKRENHRSARLLERLGLSLASPEQHVRHQVEHDEILMQRQIHPTSRNS